jgi:hypothetical protein
MYGAKFKLEIIGTWFIFYSGAIRTEFDVVQKEVRTVSFVYGIPRSFPSIWLPSGFLKV